MKTYTVYDKVIKQDFYYISNTSIQPKQTYVGFFKCKNCEITVPCYIKKGITKKIIRKKIICNNCGCKII